MTKFTEKSLHSYPMAFYYAAMKAMNEAVSFLESCIAHRVLITLSLPTRFLKLAISLSKALSSVSYSLPNP